MTIIPFHSYAGGGGVPDPERFYEPATVDPRYNEPGYNEVPVITKYTLWSRQNYSNLYGT